MVEEERKAGGTKSDEGRVQGMTDPPICAFHTEAATALCRQKRPEGPHETCSCGQACAYEHGISEKRWKPECAGGQPTPGPEGKPDRGNGEQNPEGSRAEDAKKGVHDFISCASCAAARHTLEIAPRE